MTIYQKNFSKIATSFILIKKTILTVLFSPINFNFYNFNNSKVAKNSNLNTNNIDESIKNLVKVKNIKILANFTKFVKTKANRDFKIGFFTIEVKLAFIQLRQIFIQILIFYNYHLKYYIWIETNIFSFVINRVFN